MKFVYIILSIALLSNCVSDDCYGIDCVEESGFSMAILNYSDKEYMGCTFYAGTYNNNGAFVILDSILAPDIVITKFNEGKINPGNNFSTTEITKLNSTGLNKYGAWTLPTKAKLKEFNGAGELYILFELNQDKSSFIKKVTGTNGTILIRIFEDYTLGV